MDLCLFPSAFRFTFSCSPNMPSTRPFQSRNDFVLFAFLGCMVVFRLCSSVPFVWAVAAAVSHGMRPGAEPPGAVVPAGRLVYVRDTTVRTVRTEQRRARGYSTTSVEKQSTAPRESLLDCSVRSSFWIFSTLRLAASRCLSTEWLLERLRLPFMWRGWSSCMYHYRYVICSSYASLSDLSVLSG